MNKESQFTGDVYVQEVAFVTDLPAAVALEKSPWGGKPTIDPTLPVAGTLDASKYASASAWKSTNGKVTVSQGASGSGVKFTGKGIGKEFDELSAKVAPFNLDSFVVVRVRAKAKGNISPSIRLDVVDGKGKQTNGRPQEFVVDNGGDFKDYYVNMSTNYYQRSPSYSIVNVKNTNALKLYVNFGKTKGFDGEIEISEIEPITLDSAPEEIKSIFE